MARGEKPRYDGRWRPENAARLGLTPPGGVTPVIRFRNPDDGRSHVRRSRQRADHGRERGARRPRAHARGRRADLQLRRGRRRHRHEHHARHTRRRSRQQHAAADQHLQGARREAAAVRARADDSGLAMASGSPSATAQSASCNTATKVICPRRSSTISRGSAGRTATKRSSRASKLVEWFDLRHISRSPARFDPEKLAWLERAIHQGNGCDARLARTGGAVSGGGRVRCRERAAAREGRRIAEGTREHTEGARRMRRCTSIGRSSRATD